MKTMYFDSPDIKQLSLQEQANINGGIGGLLLGLAGALYAVYQLGEICGREYYFATHQYSTARIK